MEHSAHAHAAATSLGEQLAADGFAVARGCLAAEAVRRLCDALETALAAPSADASVRRRGAVYAVRNLLDVVDAVRALPSSPPIRELVRPVLGRGAAAVRALLFDKSPAANWQVAWHQDLAIAVARRIDAPGFGPWSVKAGVPHVQPPDAILERILTVRLHLDDCPADNGALRVIPGSHAHGRLAPAAIDRLRRGGCVEVGCAAGDALVMRPLLLHASSKSTAPGRRRVLHLEFAAAPLPAPLQWHRWLPVSQE